MECTITTTSGHNIIKNLKLKKNERTTGLCVQTWQPSFLHDPLKPPSCNCQTDEEQHVSSKQTACEAVNKLHICPLLSGQLHQRPFDGPLVCLSGKKTRQRQKTKETKAETEVTTVDDTPRWSKKKMIHWTCICFSLDSGRLAFQDSGLYLLAKKTNPVSTIGTFERRQTRQQRERFNVKPWDDVKLIKNGTDFLIAGKRKIVVARYVKIRDVTKFGMF